MLHNLLWLSVCVLLVAAALRLVRWSACFPATPAPQQEPHAPDTDTAPKRRRRHQAQTGDDSAFTRAA